MFNYARVNAYHFIIQPNKDISKFAKKSVIYFQFWRRTRFSDMNFLYNICFGRDIYGDSLFNIGQVSLRIHHVYSI